MALFCNNNKNQSTGPSVLPAYFTTETVKISQNTLLSEIYEPFFSDKSSSGAIHMPQDEFIFDHVEILKSVGYLGNSRKDKLISQHIDIISETPTVV